MYRCAFCLRRSSKTSRSLNESRFAGGWNGRLRRTCIGPERSAARARSLLLLCLSVSPLCSRAAEGGGRVESNLRGVEDRLPLLATFQLTAHSRQRDARQQRDTQLARLLASCSEACTARVRLAGWLFLRIPHRLRTATLRGPDRSPRPHDPALQVLAGQAASLADDGYACDLPQGPLWRSFRWPSPRPNSPWT